MFDGLRTYFVDNTDKQTIAPLGAVTTFTYSPLGQLLTSTDPCGHTTSYTYDKLGRMTSRTHPDAGTDSYYYDPAGNLVEYANQKLQNANRRIEYHYTYNRLDSILYPFHFQNNVRYTYGTPSDAPNSLGRVVAVEDASGFQTFNYGKMGEVIENYRTFVLPNNPHFSYTFRMGYLYDSWNRILQMTYPDGEMVDYLYSLGGELDRMVGQKGNDISIFVDRIIYNKFGQRKEIAYGNGCHTTYQYDVLQRLENMTTQDWYGNDMQNITYQYDHVSNIVHIQNGTLPLPNGLGGAYDYHFVYDYLYRLVDSWGDWNNHTAHYRVRPTYFANGRMATKEVEVLPFPDPHYKYDYTYAYNNPNKPNTLTDILGQDPSQHQIYTWDANGNMQTQQYLANNVQIRHCWDEENRLMGVRNAQMAGYYQYDAQGERTYKSSYEVQSMMVNGHTMLSAIKPLETLYASPYMVGTRYGYTKHYFAGAERIASKTGTGGLADINQPVCTAQQLTMKREQNNILEDIVLHGCLQFANVGSNEEQLKVLHDLATAQGPEQECYWYHPDHIGSTAWVSGVTGTGIEHRCYLPFGEPFVTQQLPGAWNPRYTFSGKERDEETGYSYFGARYYHPDLSIWLSVDPMSDKYPSLSPYTYCGNNPVRLVDADGRFPIEIHRKLFQNAVRGQDCGLIYTMVQYGNSIYADVVHQGRSSTHMDNMKGTESIRNAYIKAMSSFNSNMKAGKYVAAGENLHTIADFYSHSNYVELYQRYMGDKIKTANDIRPFSEMMNDDEFMAFVEKEGGLKTGKYSIWRHYSKDSESHNMMNLDLPTSNSGKVKYGNSNRYTAAKNAAQKAINKIVEPYLNNCN